jgi:hypothetical protein
MLAVASWLALFTSVDFARGWEINDRLCRKMEAALLTGIAFVIRHKPRARAVPGLALCVLDRVGQWMASSFPGSLLVTVKFPLALARGIRDSCFSQICPLPENAPSIEQSFRSLAQNPPLLERDEGRK